MAQTSLTTNNISNFNNPILDRVIIYKNIKPNNAHYYDLIKNLPAHNYIRCFCPIHGDQPDNDKHKCYINENDKHCISSLRYNCSHCSNENGRSLSHVAFQKHLRKFHSNILEKMKIKDNIEKNENSYSQLISATMPLKNNTQKENNFKTKNIQSYDNSIKSYLHSKKRVLISKKENSISNHKIQNSSFSTNKNKNISIKTEHNNNNSQYSSPFISLQIICAFELLIDKTLEIVFHESYLSYDIPTKLMVLKYALTDDKISCDKALKEKMIKCIETLENYFNIGIKMDSIDLEKELRLFLQFLFNYTKNL